MDIVDVIPYPPVFKITLAIKQLHSVPERSSIEVDVLGIKETGKKFNLNPKPRPTATVSMSSPVNTPPYSPQSEQGKI